MKKEDPSGKLAKDPSTIDVTGYGSRADWEVVYIKARELARKHGLSVDQFEMEPVEPGEDREAPEGGAAAQGPAAGSDCD